MNRCVVLLLAPLLASVIGCGQNDAGQQAIRDDPEASFAEFASLLYDQLETQPLGGGESVDVGLFGDLNVVGGESIIMGRYRYLTETGDSEPKARMGFLVRETNTRGDPVPVTLHFVARNGMWHLEEATHDAEGPQTTSFKDALVQNFDGWIASAVERAQEEWPSK